MNYFTKEQHNYTIFFFRIYCKTYILVLSLSSLKFCYYKFRDVLKSSVITTIRMRIMKIDIFVMQTCIVNIRKNIYT